MKIRDGRLKPRFVCFDGFVYRPSSLKVDASFRSVTPNRTPPILQAPQNTSSQSLLFTLFQEMLCSCGSGHLLLIPSRRRQTRLCSWTARYTRPHGDGPVVRAWQHPVIISHASMLLMAAGYIIRLCDLPLALSKAPEYYLCMVLLMSLGHSTSKSCKCSIRRLPVWPHLCRPA